VSGQVLERLGVEVAGLVDQVRLGLGDQVWVGVVGEVGQAAEDGLGLVGVEPTLGERDPGLLVPLECLGEPPLAVGVGPGGLGVGANQFGVEVAPASAATPACSTRTRRRLLSSASWAWSRVTSVSVSATSEPFIDHSGTWTRSSRLARMPVTARAPGGCVVRSRS
jgi:hypothetical protein